MRIWKINAWLNLINYEPGIVYFMLEIRMKQKINCYLTKEKVQAYSTSMIQKLLLNTQIILMIFIKMQMKNKFETNNKKY